MTYDGCRRRARAEDHAFNVERWPIAGADAATTLYTWSQSGTVRDNRGAPLAGAQVEIDPPAFHAGFQPAVLRAQYTAGFLPIVHKASCRSFSNNRQNRPVPSGPHHPDHPGK